MSSLKLQNVNSGARLHSHDVKYGSGSGQQVNKIEIVFFFKSEKSIFYYFKSVTAVRNADDHNSYWQILPKVNGKCDRGFVKKHLFYKLFH